MNRSSSIAPLVAIALLGWSTPAALAQCAAGTVLWVSDAVNANVGTAASPAGVNALCAANTVVGAAYNDINQPFGIQAAMDCACQGSFIRILAGANNYDSTSASWNNRVDATKFVYLPVVGGFGYQDTVQIGGYVDASTPCLSTTQANCPIVVDFDTGTGDGFQNRGGFNAGDYGITGLHVQNAAGICIDIVGADGILTLFANETSGCGTNGIAGNTATTYNMSNWGHDNGDTLQLAGTSFLHEAYNSGGSGIALNGETTIQERTLSYDNVGSGYVVQSGNSVQNAWFVAYNNGDDGYNGATGSKPIGGINSGVFVDNGDWGAVDYADSTTSRSRKSVFFCLTSYGNATGDFSNPTTLEYAGVRSVPVISEVISYPAAPDFTPTAGVCASAVNCGYTYPGTDTTTSFVPGASAVCGGGITIQPVRVR